MKKLSSPAHHAVLYDLSRHRRSLSVRLLVRLDERNGLRVELLRSLLVLFALGVQVEPLSGLPAEHALLHLGRGIRRGRGTGGTQAKIIYCTTGRTGKLFFCHLEKSHQCPAPADFRLLSKHSGLKNCEEMTHLFRAFAFFVFSSTLLVCQSPRSVSLARYNMTHNRDTP